VGKQDKEPYYPVGWADDKTLSSDNYLWAFGGDPYHVLVYNRTSGFGQTLVVEGDMAVMRPKEYAWDLLPNGDGFVLRIPGTPYTCINQFGGGNGPLKFWDSESSPTDDGSTFRITGGGVTDDIENLTPTLSQGDDTIYDLAGRRVIRPAHGIYIKNGKKVFVK
jgi:hypothetical protein